MTEIEQPTKHLPPLKTYRILTLEDTTNIDKLVAACKSSGHQVVPATTIAESIVFLETKDHVDVIVSSAHLHDESVFEFLTRVKAADSHLKNVPFVMLCCDAGLIATLTSPAVEVAASMMGADKYLFMPVFDAEQLMAEITMLFPPIPLKELASID